MMAHLDKQWKHHQGQYAKIYIEISEGDCKPVGILVRS